MNESQVTIQDVAARAGVAPSTVSRVLNGYPDVSEKTREKVLKAVAEMNFQRNHSARHLRSGRTNSISVMLPHIDTDFYPRLVMAIDNSLEDRHYTAALYPLLTEERLARYRNENAQPYQADGLILVSLDPSRLYQGEPPTKIPIVLVETKNPAYDSVTVDNEFGGYLAGRHLSEVSADPYIIMVEERFSTPFASGVFHQRLAGFKRALGEAGINLPDDHVITMEYSWAGGRLAARKIFEKARFPVNIFATCDLMARGVIDEALSSGLRVGRDVRVVGFDDQLWAEAIGLTTIRQPIEEMGRTAVELLLDRLNKPDSPVRTIQLTPELVRRASTRLGGDMEYGTKAQI